MICKQFCFPKTNSASKALSGEITGDLTVHLWSISDYGTLVVCYKATCGFWNGPIMNHVIQHQTPNKGSSESLWCWRQNIMGQVGQFVAIDAWLLVPRGQQQWDWHCRRYVRLCFQWRSVSTTCAISALRNEMIKKSKYIYLSSKQPSTGVHGRIRRHQLETFSLILSLFVGNAPVGSEFPSQSQVTRSFDGFSDLRPNRRLNKQSRRRWFEKTWRLLWCHRNGI